MIANRDSLTPRSGRGRLVVLTGPSGVGKGTVVAEARRLAPEVWVSVSATTRAPRPGEVDGRHYFFWSDDRFTAEVAAGALLEWAQFAGSRYGTPRAAVEEHLAAGQSVLLEIELQGARQILAAEPDAVLVFLKPPSFAELEGRLRGRGTEDAEAVERRMARARVELAAQDEFHHVIVNDDVTRAAGELVDLLRS